jgi:hypothetical protein
VAKQKFFETDEFKKVQKEWIKKLKESGFEDSEYFEDYKDELTLKPKIIEPAKNLRVLTGGDAVYNLRVASVRKMVNGISTIVETVVRDDDYYQFCHRLLRELDFKSEFDTKAEARGESVGITKGERNRYIFELHTEGQTQDEIVKTMSDELGFTMDRGAISRVIDTVKARFIEIERG